MGIDNIRLVTAPDISWHGKKTKKCSYKFLTKVLEVDTRGVPNHEMLTVRFEYMFICTVHLPRVHPQTPAEPRRKYDSRARVVPWRLGKFNLAGEEMDVCILERAAKIVKAAIQSIISAEALSMGCRTMVF